MLKIIVLWATITLAVNDDDGSSNRLIDSDHVMHFSQFSVINVRSDWFFLVLITFWQMIHCSLQTKTNKKAVLWQGNRTYDADVKFDTYRNLQRHRAVLHAIARLSCSCKPGLAGFLLILSPSHPHPGLPQRTGQNYLYPCYIWYLGHGLSPTHLHYPPSKGHCTKLQTLSPVTQIRKLLQKKCLFKLV